MIKNRIIALEAKIKRNLQKAKVVITSDLNLVSSPEIVYIYEVAGEVKAEHQKDSFVKSVLEEFENKY